MITPDPIIKSPIDPQVTPEQEASLLRLARRFDGVALILGGVALIALTSKLEELLTPFVVIVAFYMLLAPFRDYKAARAMMWTGGFLFGFWFFVTLSGLLVPFILAGLLAYLFNPLVTRLKARYHIARGWSAGVVVLIVFGILALLGWLFIPSLLVEAQAFISRLSKFLNHYANTIDEAHIRDMLVQIGLPYKTATQIVSTQLGPQLKKLFADAPVFFLAIITKIPHWLERTLNLIIVPFATFYLLKDWPKMIDALISLLPIRSRARQLEIWQHVDKVLYAYIRGQLTVATIIGVLGFIAFMLLGVPYYGLLGLLIGLSDLIPIVGMVFSVVAVEIVIFLTMEINVGVVLSGIGIIALLHIIEAYVIGPRIVGEGVGIPPIMMILALLIFGYFMGFIGLLIAVPSTAVLMLFINEYRTLQGAEATTPAVLKEEKEKSS